MAVERATSGNGVHPATALHVAEARAYARNCVSRTVCEEIVERRLGVNRARCCVTIDRLAESLFGTWAVRSGIGLWQVPLANESARLLTVNR